MSSALVNGLRFPTVICTTLFGLAYFAGAELGYALTFTDAGQSFATFWPPAGILLAMLVQSPFHKWPILLTASIAAELVSNFFVHNMPVAAGIGFCAAHCIEGCLGAWLLVRFVGAPFSLSRMRTVLGLACGAGVVSTMIGALIGAAVAMAVLDAPSFGTAWLVWWNADSVGVLIFAPVVFACSTGGDAFVDVHRPRRIVEVAAIVVPMVLVMEAIYGDWLLPPLRAPIFVLPFLLWAGWRFGPSTAAMCVLLVALIGLWNTSQGRGPFAGLTNDVSERLLRAQTSLGMISLCVLVLAAALAERKAAEQQRLLLIAQLERALGEIKTLQGLIPICAWCKKIRNDQGFWQRLEDYLLAHTDARLTHGMCPECLKEQLPNINSADS
jgi:integral membrane sensor domain MASE1